MRDHYALFLCRKGELAPEQPRCLSPAALMPSAPLLAPPQGCIRRERTPEAAPEAVRQAVGRLHSRRGAVAVGYKCH